MEKQSEKIVFHAAESRGLANHGWLVSRHTFSFANYFDPDRVQFGALRVLNDDVVQPGAGFGLHPHENMEIVSIPLAGSLAHKDSSGHEQIIKPGEVQIMSAGSGIYHSEYNHSKQHEVNFLQIWVLPKEKDITPRYEQMDFSEAMKRGGLFTIVSPTDPKALKINQDAFFSLGTLKKNTTIVHQLHRAGHGIYAFLIDGKAIIAGHTLDIRDAIGLTNQQEVTIEAIEESTLLLIEIPINY